MLSSPMPAFFLNGNVYRGTSAYRADTGTLMQRYLPNLGDAAVYQPQLVNGILYMAVRSAAFHDNMAMYAVRASDGSVLWKWDTCGESVNMSSPIIIDDTVYFVCETAPLNYDLYALHANTGKRLWLDTFSGEVEFDLCASQKLLYVQMRNQLVAEDTATGHQVWQQSFGTSSYYIGSVAVDRGILYVVYQQTFFALRASNGEHLWEYDFIDGYNSLEAFTGQNTVYLFARQLSKPTAIYALNATSGALLWQKALSESNYGTPVIDQGNLYLVVNVFPVPQTDYASPLKRTLIAIRGSDGDILWRRDVPWNSGRLNYAMIEPPMVSAGGGRVYLVDWQPSFNFSNLRATLGAFSENNGALLWTRGNFAQS